MRRFAPVLLGLLLIGPASVAQAATINIDFDLSGSTVSILGGIIDVPPDGSFTLATATLVVEGAGISTPQPSGQVTLWKLRLKGNIDADILGQAHITGNFDNNALNQPMGTLDGGAANVLFGQSLQLGMNTHLNCAGSACGSIAAFPLDLTGPSTLTALGAIPIAGLGTYGAANFAASFSVSVSGYTMLVSLVGQEISREYAQIPEPNTFALVAIGLTGLGALAARRRAR
jgi:hypothetical protein